MSKAKKLKKVNKKPMSPKTKNILVNSFKGIISNQACIDNGKEAPWWLAILFFLFAIIIPLIPSHVQLSKAYGSAFLAASSYETDAGFAAITYRLNDSQSKLEIEDGILSYYKNGGDSFTGTEQLISPLSITQKDKEGNDFTFYSFVAYFTTGGKTAVDEIKTNHLRFVHSTTIAYDETDPTHVEKGYYVPTFIIFQPDTVELSVQKLNSREAVATAPIYLDYKHTTGDLIARALTGLDMSKYANEAAFLSSAVAVNHTYTYWKIFFDEAYLTQKEAVKWNTTLIYLGVYAGLMVFLGLMLFLLTRGKNNPFHSLNFWVCQKMGYFLSWTPAVLAMIIGFIITTNVISQMAFIMLVSLRVMWASMRQLRPVQ